MDILLLVLPFASTAAWVYFWHRRGQRRRSARLAEIRAANRGDW